MPKYFGEENPDISEDIIFEILCHLDNRTLVFILPFVSKQWRLIMQSDQFSRYYLKPALKLTFRSINIENSI